MSAIGGDAINIRRMTRSDIDAILALVNRTTNAKTHVTYKDLAAYDPGGPLDLSLVAEAKGQIIGFVLARLEYVYIPFVEVCLIHAIVVDPEYQRRHIGSALVNELSSRCHLQDINTIRALVRQNDNELQSFIEHLGFHASTMVNWDKTFEAWPPDG
jgi:N-acetylglutamate synthase-like GNAT family acetyltransferase